MQAELYVARALQLLEPSVSVQRASAQLLVQQSSAGLLHAEQVELRLQV